MANVQVDIWHCNASGIYSAEDVEDTSGETWLRGYQITDANGLATFKTVIPGWYAGRTTHIHLRLRSTYDSTSNGGTNTTQLFFPQDVINTVGRAARRRGSPVLRVALQAVNNGNSDVALDEGHAAGDGSSGHRNSRA